MIRRITLTLIPCVAVFTAAACLSSTLAPRATKSGSILRTTAPAQQLAKRSGYIVASS